MRLAPFAASLPNPAAGDRTLDEILAANAARAPGGFALLARGLPFSGDWTGVDSAVSGLAATFAEWALGEDAVVGVQLGSTPEAALACLALWRAGLTPAMLPLAWRRREITAALASIGATALIAPVEGGGAPLAQFACEIAAGLETIRFVGCFGGPAPDGATPLDHAFDRDGARHVRPDRPEDAADHIAVVTFEAGGAPVARSHNDLAAAALGPILAMRLTAGSSLVSTLDLAGLAGVATGLVPWLLSGAGAAFHPVSTAAALKDVVRAADATHIALPGRVAGEAFADSGLDEAGLVAVAVWRAPDGRGAAADIPGASVIVDAVAFGELGMFATVRPTRTRHAPVPLGPARPAERVAPLIEFKIGDDGRLALRGPACPQAPCPSQPAAPDLAFDPQGFVETGLAAVADPAAGHVAFGGRRRGVAQIGGVALAMPDVESAYRRAGVKGLPTLVDDPLFGARLTLAGTATDNAAAAAETLDAAGFGPAVAPVERAAEPARKTA
ncbi:AMP-binding protein [Chenggangzhangella methanolivorans]|uniref:AMP-binding protein n=1 Tax=Chenggangzhangella methanolivorans TaxID=1437009 RepID=UPI00360DD65A